MFKLFEHDNIFELEKMKIIIGDHFLKFGSTMMLDKFNAFKQKLREMIKGKSYVDCELNQKVNI